MSFVLERQEKMRKRKVDLQKASLNSIKFLFDTGCIGWHKRQDLICKVEAGDKTGYKELKEILIKVANEIGKE